MSDVKTPTNVERVRKALARLSGKFTLQDVVNLLAGDEFGGLNSKQVGDALRRISYVTGHGNGQYSVKGRRVLS